MENNQRKHKTMTPNVETGNTRNGHVLGNPEFQEIKPSVIDLVENDPKDLSKYLYEPIHRMNICYNKLRVNYVGVGVRSMR